MERALIVSRAEKGSAFFSEILCASSYGAAVSLHSCEEARRRLSERDFDLVIIDAPLADESGEGLSRQIAANGTAQVILVIKGDRLYELSPVYENDGVFTVSKPVNRAVFMAVLKAARAAQSRLRKLYAENIKLAQKIEEMRIIDRAKCVLISYLQINEQEAHRYIEKRAMDMRATKRAVAEDVLKTYETKATR